ALVLAEVVFFSAKGTHFLTLDNGYEMARASVEIGLLALALTGVILTGGIDLSVGSLLGLAAVITGFCAREAGWPMPLAPVAGGGRGGPRGRGPERAARRAPRHPAAHRDPRHAVALPRARRRLDGRRAELHGLPAGLPVPGPGPAAAGSARAASAARAGRRL